VFLLSVQVKGTRQQPPYVTYTMSPMSSTRPGQRGRLSSWFSGVHRIWDAVQAELHGDYPIDHIKAFHAYAERTPWWRALLICFATPVPAVLFLLLSEVVPLEDPKTHDARSSPNVWIRFLLMTTTGSMCVLEQFRQHVPSLALSRRAMATIAIPSSIATTFGGYLIAVNVAYPMPFTPNIAMTPWIVILVGLLLFTVRQQLRGSHSCWSISSAISLSACASLRWPLCTRSTIPPL
jgi:hypothetical protein